MKKEIHNISIENVEIKVRMAYILRLRDYVLKVRDTVNGNDMTHKMAIIALLGYLEALETLTPISR